MDHSQADPFVGSAASSRSFQKLLEASIVDIHTVQKMYSGAYGGHFGYCRRFGVADGEREPLASRSFWKPLEDPAEPTNGSAWE